VRRTTIGMFSSNIFPFLISHVNRFSSPPKVSAMRLNTPGHLIYINFHESSSRSYSHRKAAAPNQYFSRHILVESFVPSPGKHSNITYRCSSTSKYTLYAIVGVFCASMVKKTVGRRMGSIVFSMVYLDMFPIDDFRDQELPQRSDRTLTGRSIATPKCTTPRQRQNEDTASDHAPTSVRICPPSSWTFPARFEG
jgi:hypothetical protein